MSDEFRRFANPGHVVVALAVVVLGLLLLLGNLGLLPSRNILNYWPLVFVVAGALHVLQAGSGYHKAFGAFLFMVGWLLLANNLRILQFRIWDYWPLLLIFWGVMLLVRTLRGETPGCPRGTALSNVDQVSIFGGGRRVVSGDHFEGGRITAVFGGAEVDLRPAGMKSDLAAIEANVMFGGAEIKVPQNWDVVVRGIGIFGGFGDETLHPTPGTPGVKRLIVRGSAIFGGVTVKN